MKTSDILKENQRRITDYFRDYDRLVGDTHSETVDRFKFNCNGTDLYLPATMKELPIINQLLHKPISQLITELKGHTNTDLEHAFLIGFINDRFKHDFEYWSYKCAPIQDKLSKKSISFKLNKGQRELIRAFEDMRISGVPIRVILVKARQWGGSTCIQIYMLWLQLYHYRNWHSAIVAQFQQQSVNIRAMITNLIATYPSEVERLSLKPFEGTTNIKYIPQRGCRISIGSADNPEALRSFDFAMLHLSECGLWKSTTTKSADDLVQALYVTVPDIEGTFICLESTAKGIGTFFHKEYLQAAKGESANKLVFIPWFKIINYAAFKIEDQAIKIENGIPVSKIKNPQKEIDKWTPYNKYLWKQGATMEGIVWYNWYQKKKNYSDFMMKSEFPTTASEAFQSNASRYFTQEVINKVKNTVTDPIFKGDIKGDSLSGPESLKGLKIVEANDKPFYIWQYPDTSEKWTERYLVTVDIGGKSEKSDFSTINVFDRITLTDPHFGALERVATWRGHIDHDLLAWKAAQIAKIYDNALLVIESNTLETKDRKKSDTQYEGDHFYTVLDEIAEDYDNMYTRSVDPDKARGGLTFRYGWHMNKRTKYLAYDATQKAIRDDEYVETDIRTVNEIEWLEIKPDGSLGAVIGENDDLIDPTAIANYVSKNEMGIPKKININQTQYRPRSVGVATI